MHPLAFHALSRALTHDVPPIGDFGPKTVRKKRGVFFGCEFCWIRYFRAVAMEYGDGSDGRSTTFVTL